MSAESTPDDLQFDRAEPVSEANVSHHCVACGEPITDTYYAVGNEMACPRCRELATAPPPGTRAGRLIKATIFGVLAGIAGAVLWFAVRRITNLEIGVIAVVVGFMVGKAVHKGANGVGGLGYQLLAVAITYSCIAANYMPDIIEAVFRASDERVALEEGAPANEALVVVDEESAPVDEAQVAEAGEVVDQEIEAAELPVLPNDKIEAAPEEPVSAGELAYGIVILLIVAFALSLAAPFLSGAQNLIGLLIIGFALWEAWKFNARRKLEFSGPFHLNSGPTQ